MNTQNTSVQMDDTTAQPSEKNDAKTPETAEKDKKASNASYARKRIAEREAKKAMKADITSELDPEEDEMIKKSSVGKKALDMEERLSFMEERADANEVEREVAKFVKNHEYSEYLDENALIVKALDPKYAHLELDEIAWLQLKEKMPEIYSKQSKEAGKKIAKTALPSTAGKVESIENMSLADYAKNRHTIIENLSKS